MKKRFFTGIIIAIVYVGTILLSLLVHPVFFDIFTVLIMMAASLEMSRAVGPRFGRPVDLAVLAEILLGYLAFVLTEYFLNGKGGVTAWYAVLLAVYLVCLLYVRLSKEKTARNATSTLLVLLYPVTILVYMLALNYLPDPFRVPSILLLFLVSTLTDTFAYLVGSTFKGPKLCPNISPKKTVSGAVGGLIGGMLGGAVVLLFSEFSVLGVEPIGRSLGTNIAHFLVIGFFASIFNQVGDLVASYVKRLCGIKDYGNILPGHGGFMDRIDGMMLAGVFVYLYMLVLTVL